MFSKSFLVTWLEACIYTDVVRNIQISQGWLVHLVRTSVAQLLSRYHKNAIVTSGMIAKHNSLWETLALFININQEENTRHFVEYYCFVFLWNENLGRVEGYLY